MDALLTLAALARLLVSACGSSLKRLSVSVPEKVTPYVTLTVSRVVGSGDGAGVGIEVGLVEGSGVGTGVGARVRCTMLTAVNCLKAAALSPYTATQELRRRLQ